MATTARLDLRAWRNDDVFEFRVQVRGVDLSALALVMQLRLTPDAPGPALVSLAKVTNGNAQGLRVAGVAVVDGVPVSDLRIRINKSTLQGLPYLGEVGDASPLAYALLIAGRTRLVGNLIVLAHAYGSDGAPLGRVGTAGSPQSAMPGAGAGLTIAGDDVAAVTIDGTDLVAGEVSRAIEAKEAAESSADASALAAATALASSRFFPSRAAGEAASTNGQLFSTDDGAGTLIFYRDTGSGSVEIGRALTPARINEAFVLGAGDGAADDTAAVIAAAGTGKPVTLSADRRYAVTQVTGLDAQRLAGGGELRKRLIGGSVTGADKKAMLMLDDGADGVRVDGVAFDGSRGLFAPGDPVSAVQGYATRDVRVTFAEFREVNDGGIKLLDGGRLFALGSLFENGSENGIEVHNYGYDPRGGPGTTYAVGLPDQTSGHQLIANTFRRIERYEPTDGSALVDGTAATFPGAPGRPQTDVVIVANVSQDCLRHYWFENNPANSESDGTVIASNALSGSGDPGVYTKAGIGLIGARNVAIGLNVFRNLANHRPMGTRTACLTVSGGLISSTTEGRSEGLLVTSNVMSETSGDTDRTQYGIDVSTGRHILIAHNVLHGSFGVRALALYGDAPGEDTPGHLVDVACYGNVGADGEYSWHQPVPFVFARRDVSASGTSSTFPFGLDFDDELVLPAAGRVVGISVKLSQAIQSGDFDLRVWSSGQMLDALAVSRADFAQQVAIRQLSSLEATQLQPGARLKVDIVTDDAFSPDDVIDVIVTLYVDLGMKR